MTIQAQVNGRDVQFNSEPDTPLLWAVREELGLTGTKFGCGTYPRIREAILKATGQAAAAAGEA